MMSGPVGVIDKALRERRTYVQYIYILPRYPDTLPARFQLVFSLISVHHSLFPLCFTSSSFFLGSIFSRFYVSSRFSTLINSTQQTGLANSAISTWAFLTNSSRMPLPYYMAA
ncbi:hypothetical protein ABW19_dt0209287 [Dactylella cylindrospora]|nr:hypothetical protein ABW19_dt0209287 [Dactylella cylindrospora]